MVFGQNFNASEPSLPIALKSVGVGQVLVVGDLYALCLEQARNTFVSLQELA